MTTTDEVLDILDDTSETLRDEPGADGDTPAGAGPAGYLPSPRALYNRWEQQQWSVAKVRVQRDAPVWATLRPFARRELTDALAELEVGEVCVTRTLSSLVDHAPGDEDRIYLCTQMADEGRHVRFFQEYLTEAAGVALDAELDAASAYGQLFEPRLYASTSRVRTADGDRAAWYTALVEYHLVTEGVLAASALRTTRLLARRFDLAALEEGLTNVARDESRHLTYGLAAARQGVESGYADVVTAAYLGGVELASRVMVNPHRRAVAPVLRAALLARARQLTGQWQMGLDRAVRQLRLIGLPHLRTEVETIWQAAQQRALEEYRERWDAVHPVVTAAA